MTHNNPTVKEVSEESSQNYFIFQIFILRHVIFEILSGWVLGCTFFFFFLISCMNEYNVAFEPFTPPPPNPSRLLWTRTFPSTHSEVPFHTRRLEGFALLSETVMVLNRYRMMYLKRKNGAVVYLKIRRTVCCSFIEIFQIFKRILQNKCVNYIGVCNRVASLCCA